MESIKKLENMIEGWLKPLPHLPANAQKWIAINIWWLELIGVVILAFSGIALLGTLGLALGITSTIFGVSTFSGLIAISSIVSLASKAASVVVMAFAISPLKSLKKKGWDLLFIALLINCVSVVLSALIYFNAMNFITSLLSGAVGAAIGAYFLFEIRSYFVSVKK